MIYGTIVVYRSVFYTPLRVYPLAIKFQLKINFINQIANKFKCTKNHISYRIFLFVSAHVWHDQGL